MTGEHRQVAASPSGAGRGTPGSTLTRIAVGSVGAPRADRDPTRWPVGHAALFKRAEPFAHS
jgi:hypothetical protein